MEKQDLRDGAWRLWEAVSTFQELLEAFLLEKYLSKRLMVNHDRNDMDLIRDDVPF